MHLATRTPPNPLESQKLSATSPHIPQFHVPVQAGKHSARPPNGSSENAARKPRHLQRDTEQQHNKLGRKRRPFASSALTRLRARYTRRDRPELRRERERERRVVALSFPVVSATRTLKSMPDIKRASTRLPPPPSPLCKQVPPNLRDKCLRLLVRLFVDSFSIISVYTFL